MYYIFLIINTLDCMFSYLFYVYDENTCSFHLHRIAKLNVISD